MEYSNFFNISIDKKSNTTKFQQLIDEIIRIVNTDLKEGDALPSVNEISQLLDISRDTVFKAYKELKQRGIVDSTPAKGYFVGREMNRVLLLLDYYSPFKDMVYQEIERGLDKSYSIDLVFHNYNTHLYESVILQSTGRYNAYIIMNIDTKKFIINESIKKLDPSKILFLDIPVYKWKSFKENNYSYIWQNFNEAVYNSLCAINTYISKYKMFYLLLPEDLQHPRITINAFEKFCLEFNINNKIIKSLDNIKISKGDAFFVFQQKDLTSLLEMNKEYKLEPGKEIGILAYNDTPIYEFVASGITVISADFREMGRKAVKFIKDGRKIQETISTDLIIRNSL